jgi:hypothetical protein
VRALAAEMFDVHRLKRMLALRQPTSSSATPARVILLECFEVDEVLTEVPEAGPIIVRSVYTL